MSDISALRFQNTDTSNNNIRLETPDMREGEFGMPFPVISLMHTYVRILADIPATLKRNLPEMGKDELYVRKVLMTEKLLDQSGDWTTKDANIMAEVAMIILLLFRHHKKVIESIMYGLCDAFLDDTTEGIITENEYKNNTDIMMRLKNSFVELERFDLHVEPQGRWGMMGDKKVLILMHLY
jgi:hypothetical protein